MNRDLAYAIVKEAKSRGIAIPDEPTVQLQAEKLEYEAGQAFAQGVRGENVMVILRMVGNDVPESPGESASARKSFLDDVLISKESRLRQENLPVPPEIEGEPPVLPRDITKSSDLEVRRLMSEFNACYARANFLTAIAEADEDNAKLVFEYRRDKKVAEIERAPENKNLSVGAAKALALENEEVEAKQVEWLDRRRDERALKSMRDIYDKACERISREWSMRDKEREKKV